MKDKLIIPAEFKVCATCSFWDGERRVDEELHVVVVAHAGVGECLVREQGVPGMLASQYMKSCLWEPIHDGGLARQAEAQPETDSLDISASPQ